MELKKLIKVLKYRMDVLSPRPLVAELVVSGGSRFLHTESILLLLGNALPSLTKDGSCSFLTSERTLLSWGSFFLPFLSSKLNFDSKTGILFVDGSGSLSISQNSLNWKLEDILWRIDNVVDSLLYVGCLNFLWLCLKKIKQTIFILFKFH